MSGFGSLRLQYLRATRFSNARAGGQVGGRPSCKTKHLERFEPPQLPVRWSFGNATNTGCASLMVNEEARAPPYKRPFAGSSHMLNHPLNEIHTIPGPAFYLPYRGIPQGIMIKVYFQALPSMKNLPRETSRNVRYA